MNTAIRPEKHESNNYFRRYIDLVPEMPVLKLLENQLQKLPDALSSLTPEEWDFRYDKGKWNLKEMWLHVIDTERIFAYRALRIARGDQTALPGFDQDEFAKDYSGLDRSPYSLIDEFVAVRKASIELFKNFTQENFGRKGTASASPLTPRAVAYILAGHTIHHLNLMNEKYLAKSNGL